MGQQKELVIEYKSSEQVRSVLSDSVRNSLKSLTIQIYDNRNTWYTYRLIPDQSMEDQNMPHFRIKHAVDTLPELGEMSNLQSLTLSFLGLKRLPKDVGELEGLRSLDISFNFINISEELDQLKKLQNLDELIAFGLRIRASDINRLKRGNENLKVLHTEKQHADFFKEREE